MLQLHINERNALMRGAVLAISSLFLIVFFLAIPIWSVWGTRMDLSGWLVEDRLVLVAAMILGIILTGFFTYVALLGLMLAALVIRLAGGSIEVSPTIVVIRKGGKIMRQWPSESVELRAAKKYLSIVPRGTGRRIVLSSDLFSQDEYALATAALARQRPEHGEDKPA